MDARHYKNPPRIPYQSKRYYTTQSEVWNGALVYAVIEHINISDEGRIIIRCENKREAEKIAAKYNQKN